MGIQAEHIQKKHKVNIANQASLECYPEEFKKPFAKALVTKMLCLNNCQLTSVDLISFVIPFLNDHPDIKSLEVINNRIEDGGVIALAKNHTLTMLNLSLNQIGTIGAMALAHNNTLKKLDIKFNQIGAIGAKALTKNHTLTTLKASDNQIGNVGAISLAENSTLTTLDVSYNQISHEGIKALAQNNSLTKLYLDGNQIGTEGKLALQEVLERRQKKHQQQKLAFAMGTHPRTGQASPILTFSRYADKNLMREIFNYLRPKFELKI